MAHRGSTVGSCRSDRRLPLPSGGRGRRRFVCRSRLVRRHVTRKIRRSTTMSTTERAAVEQRSTADTIGSYGRGVYAGHSTYHLDFSSQGSYGRGFYAGHSTYHLDYDTPGSYGRGVYAGHSTYHLDFRPKDSYARGMEQDRNQIDTRARAARRGAHDFDRAMGAD